MSSKIRLDDLPIENLDDMDDSFFIGGDQSHSSRTQRQKRKREMIEDYMEERNLKRRINESYDFSESF